MELNFTLDQEEVYDPELMDKFCDKLVESIQIDIRNGLIPAKYSMLEESLLEATWIRWDKKPGKINVASVINAIIKCITWRKRRITYQVYIRPEVKMPYTVNTTLEQVARFIDKGNLVSKQTTLFSRVFNEYEKNIETYWNTYKEFGYILDERGKE